MQLTNSFLNGDNFKTALLFLAGALFFSCSATKDRKALGRVLTNPDLVAQVAKTLPPCANDTTIVSDSIYIIDTEIVYDTSLVTDTLIDVVDRIKVVTKTVTVDKIRTVEKVTVDNRLANQWRDSADKYKLHYIAKDKQLQDASQQRKIDKRTITIFWSVIALIILALMAYIVYKFKKP